MLHRLAALALCLVVTAADAAEPLCVADGIYVGAEPVNVATWASLAELNVRTVLGVDGLPPDRSAADAAGMRVVHVPIGYGAIPDDALQQFAAVARDCERPIYVYCHHGKHRGPAAAAVICQAAGLLDRDGAIDLLRSSGTSPAYTGLWQSVAAFDAAAPIPASVRLASRSETSPLRLAMGQLDRAWDQATTDEAPTIRKASLLVARQALVESRRGAVLASASPELADEFDQALARFEELLAANESERFGRISKQFAKACVDCHRRHRD